MYQKKLDKDIRCPLEYGMNLLSGKWKSRIVCLLGNMGPLRFAELKSELVNISDGVLGAVLIDLVKSDLVLKTSDQTSNLLIEYSLTKKGMSLLPLLQALCRWSGPYYKQSSENTMEHCLQCNFYQKWKAEIDEKEV